MYPCHLPNFSHGECLNGEVCTLAQGNILLLEVVRREGRQI
jgi:hypothetical protein